MTIDPQILSPEFFTKYDVRGPRYTSYPTVPYWSKDWTSDDWLGVLAEAAQESPSGEYQPLSLYVHIPFCKHHCAFCACNVIITSQEGIASRYLDSVEQEIALISENTAANRQVVQLHLGGGTPNYLTGEEMTRLITMLHDAYRFHPDGERSIEVDPRTSSVEEIRRLRQEHQFNRISFGAQDFHGATQEAIGRTQTYEITLKLVEESRRVGFDSINIDLIYGLPAQSRASWRETIDRFLDLRPSRLALYNFAFLPKMLSHQRGIDPNALPDVGEKLEMFLETNERLLEAGYRFIGMDHYALENDDLTRALDDGTLHRNFMGYTTLRGTDMLSFGVSAISDAVGVFSQNTKKLSVYEKELAEGRLPVERGLILSDDDLQRRWVIETLMCSGRLEKAEYRQLFDADFDAKYGAALEELEPLVADQLVVLEDDAVIVTPAGRFFLRNIAMPFDAYLGQNKPGGESARKSGKPTFSRTL
jgi:oxygen-independent coproporphyrinogen-3 oxidase